MIRHIVMWTLKEEAEGADRATNVRKFVDLLESCRDCVPGILEFETGVAQPGFEAAYDVVLNTLFESKAALEAYQSHPTHEAAKPFLGAVRKTRSCFDYEVAAK